MFKSMSSALSKKSKGNEEKTIPSGVSTRSTRRALGDITNANAPDAPGREVVKKPTLHHIISEVVEAPPIVQSANEDEDEDDDDDDMEEDERSYMRRESDDIDTRDANNPLLCTDYVNEMYVHFIDVERQFMVQANYMSNQPYINEKMRCILIDWLVEVHLKFKMVPETLYLTVQIIDRYLNVKQVRRSRLQLVGVSALLMAAKYEEIYPPELRDLVYITDRAYNKQEILEMENMILNTIEYKLTVPTAHSFLCRYLKAAHADRTMVQLSCYIAERSLQEYSLVKHPWSPTLVKYTTYDEADLQPCVSELGPILEGAEAASQQAVLRKYSSTKFGSVAKTPIVF